ncbi:PAS domain-containing protein [Halobellus inordinatus]|uniref:PAS domain-containing protein n=1 Tax=Halobellus inordinatus TaxID=1126236 RepID=UPI0021147792|nr:PAS domain-containing protein [Halobellus ramosii]
MYLLVGFVVLFIEHVVLPAQVTGPHLTFIQSVTALLGILVMAVFIYLLLWLTWRDLRLKERAINEAPIGIVLADSDGDDNRLIFANERFQTLTGYDSSEVRGCDCRLLQGEQTAPEPRQRLRTAIDEQQQASVDIRNYRRDGQLFWNKVDIAPVGESGNASHFVGFQTDITERKIREQQLTVLNRVLRHNFRTQINIITGYLELLQEHVTGESELFTPIQRAVDETLTVVSSAQRAEGALRAAAADTQGVELEPRLREIATAAREQYPNATISLTYHNSDTHRVQAGIDRALREAIQNALQHHDGPAPTVSIQLEHAEDGQLTIKIEDDGPGIPSEEITALEEGETQLTHGSHMGLWMIQWVVTYAGGSFSIPESGADGTTLVVRVPTMTATAEHSSA